MGTLGQSIIFGSIGFMLGGPLGGVLGAVIGAHMPRAGQRRGIGMQPFTATDPEQAKMVFFVATFSLLAKLAKADGVISTDEIKVIDAFMTGKLGLSAEDRKIGSEIFNQAKDSRDSFDDFARQFYQLFGTRREMLLIMLELLLQVAAADSEFHPNEEKMIQSAMKIFNLSLSEYNRLKSIYVKDTDRFYSCLGASKNESTQEIKRKYRKLVNDYHPDKIISKGLPDEFITFANKKFQEIQEAYEHIMQEREEG
ncbi:MAG: TerB family tellurite resistance protein [Candidatus Omnitrophica bacterium]|nr:TerB family tellurite resistance protein [Candidatus Omnitrophota bacterium]